MMRWTATVLALILGAATPLLFLAAALGSKYGIWDWRFGLGVMTRDWGPPTAWAGMVVAALVCLGWLVRKPRWPAVFALIAFALAALPLHGLRQQQKLVLDLPTIHDVQTDWDRPIALSAEALAEREAYGATNPVLENPIVPDDGRRGKWAGMAFADAQGDGYPDIAPLILDLPLETAFARAEATAHAQDLDIRRSWTSHMNAGIEATATTRWYGLVDDVAIRLEAVTDTTTRLDMRSISREGHIDLGENAKRIRRFLNAMAEPA